MDKKKIMRVICGVMVACLVIGLVASVIPLLV